MPINGRNYLDLPAIGCLVLPSTVSKMRAWTGLHRFLESAAATAVFLIDGMPNRDEVNGGAAAQFNQDSILEFSSCD